MKESELNVLVTIWANAQVAYLLAGHRVNMSLIDEKVTNQPMNPTDKIVKTKKSENIKVFSSKVIHTWMTTMFMGCNLRVMMHALCNENKPLPHGHTVQNTYTKRTVEQQRGSTL